MSEALSETGQEPLSVEEAERQWRIHGNEVLDSDDEYQKAEREQRHVGKIVAWAYAILVGGLLAFMIGFYLWRFRCKL